MRSSLRWSLFRGNFTADEIVERATVLKDATHHVRLGQSVPTRFSLAPITLSWHRSLPTSLLSFLTLAIAHVLPTLHRSCPSHSCHRSRPSHSSSLTSFPFFIALIYLRHIPHLAFIVGRSPGFWHSCVSATQLVSSFFVCFLGGCGGIPIPRDRFGWGGERSSFRERQPACCWLSSAFSQ
jgi:hypothetical protein